MLFNLTARLVNFPHLPSSSGRAMLWSFGHHPIFVPEMWAGVITSPLPDDMSLSLGCNLACSCYPLGSSSVAVTITGLVWAFLTLQSVCFFGIPPPLLPAVFRSSMPYA